MGLFGKERNYDTEIASLTERQNELSMVLDKSNNDILAFSANFDKHKEEIKDEFNEVWEFVKHLNNDFAEFKKWKIEHDNEKTATEKAKTTLPDTLTYKEVCKALKDFRYLHTSSFKYYLYERGILDLKINPIHNSYRISESYDSSEADVKKYINITNGVITFNKDVLEYFMKNPKELQESLDRYTRKQKQYSESKRSLSEAQVINYREEIGRICGIDNDNGNKYDQTKWGLVYGRYGIDHKNWVDKYKLWAEKRIKEQPHRYKKYDPTRLEYLVEVCGDGDVLLKIACELFVH